MERNKGVPFCSALERQIIFCSIRHTAPPASHCHQKPLLGNEPDRELTPPEKRFRSTRLLPVSWPPPPEYFQIKTQKPLGTITPKGPYTSYDLNLTPMPLPHWQTSHVIYSTPLHQGKASPLFWGIV